jgi:hypothetical protein
MNDLNLDSLSLHYNSSLVRIEKLLKIDDTDSRPLSQRLDFIHTKLMEYMTHTTSMLHECLLTLAEGVMEVDNREEEEFEDDVDDYETEDDDDDEDEDENDNEINNNSIYEETMR